jgi:hypothetical protein
MVDYESAQLVRRLVTSLTEPSQASIELQELTQLKAHLKSSEELVAYATPLLLDRLAASHAQVRSCALAAWLVLEAAGAAQHGH